MPRTGRPGLTHREKRELWHRRKAGQSLSEIGRALNKHTGSVHGVLTVIGGIDDSGARTERVVWPILLGYRDAGRILAAWCELRNSFRYFRTDRMISADILEQRIPENALVLRARWRSAMDQERESYASQPQENG